MTRTPEFNDGQISPQRYLAIECEGDLERYGPSWRGVGYTKSAAEAEERYTVMLNVIREGSEAVSVLDLGCGLAHMLDHIESNPERANVGYTGLDISSRYIEAARKRHPEAELILMDVLESDEDLAIFDYVILNGLFNFRGELSQEEMMRYWQAMISVAYRHARRGIAFNVMSKIVEWERDDLFHLPFDEMGGWVGVHVSPDFVIRHDYRAFEYTTYVYREPSGS